MTIEFIFNRSKQSHYTVGVKGNHETDTICFTLLKNQNGVDLSEFTPSLKFTTKGGTYGDTVELDEMTDSGELLKLYYTVPSKVTTLKSIDAQLQFTNGEEIWQTQIFNINFADSVDPSGVIEEVYPDVLTRLEGEIKGNAADILELQNRIDNIDVSGVTIDGNLDGDTLNVVLKNVKGEETSSASIELPYIKRADVESLIDSKLKTVTTLDGDDSNVGDYRILLKGE